MTSPNSGNETPQDETPPVDPFDVLKKHVREVAPGLTPDPELTDDQLVDKIVSGEIVPSETKPADVSSIKPSDL